MKNNFKKIFILFICCMSIFVLFACKNNESKSANANVDTKKSIFDIFSNETVDVKDRGYIEPDNTKDVFDFKENYKDKNVAIVYMGVDNEELKDIAEKISNIFSNEENGKHKVSTYEINVKNEYSDSDLDKTNNNSRIYYESKYDPYNGKYNYEEYYGDQVFETLSESEKVNFVRKLPEIKNINVGNADIVFLGYPIWYGKVPLAIYSFIEKTDLKNKVIIPFWASDDEPQYATDQAIADFADSDIYFMSGKKLSKYSTEDEIYNWIKNIGVDIVF